MPRLHNFLLKSKPFLRVLLQAISQALQLTRNDLETFEIFLQLYSKLECKLVVAVKGLFSYKFPSITYTTGRLTIRDKLREGEICQIEKTE